MNGLLLYFMMFCLLKVSSAEMTVCKKVSYDNDPEYNQQSFIDLQNEQKGNNGTKGEKGEIGKKKRERRCCSNKTNRNQPAETQNYRLG